MERNRFQILFFLRKSRKNKTGEYPIYLRVTVNGKSATTSIGQSIPGKYWNQKRNLVKPSYKDAETINDEIGKLQSDVKKARKILIDDGKIIDPRHILNVVQGKTEKIYKLIEVYSNHNSMMVSMLGKGYAASYYKNHKSTKKHLAEFLRLNFNLSDIPIKEINHKFIASFVHFLRTEKNNNQNGAMKNLVRLKKIIRIALHNDWLDKDPFLNYKMTFQKYDRIYLNQFELEKMEDIELDSTKLNKVKNLFIFSCYTGLAYADIKILCNENIVSGVDGTKWISAKRKKSGIRFTLPLLPKALEILNQYQQETEGELSMPVFPVMSNQKMNDYLKDIAKLCGINKPISFHSARHTFATTITLVNGVPIETVSKMLGHTDLSTTQIYARVIDKKIATDMKALQDKLL
jgi:site-specific recombinase XerD